MLFSQAYCFNFKSKQNSFFVKHIKFEKCKELKKMISIKFVPAAGHPNKWWNICVSDHGKIEIESAFTE